MDKILIKDMTFFGRHGVLAEEKTLGQKFMVDAVLELNLQGAGESDDLTQTVDYSVVYALIAQVMENETYDLIEAVAETICADILAVCPRVEQVTITVKKPQAPVAGIFDYFAVEITRKRNE